MSDLFASSLGLAALSTDYHALESKGLIEPFQNWLQSLSQVQPEDPAAFPNNLKLIVSALIDQHLGAQPTPVKLTSPRVCRKLRKRKLNSERSKRSVKRSKKVPQPQTDTVHREELASPTSAKRLVRSRTTASMKQRESFSATEDLSLLSDFCYIKGPSTFKRTRRVTFEVHNTSPGPAAYDPNVESYKTRSPSVRVPVSGKRIEFATCNSPGPAAYYPRRHILAKPSQ